MDATTIAVDLAKNVFEIAVANSHGRIVRRARVNRAQFATFLRDEPVTEVVMEACGSAHYWARTAQASGHRVTLLPSQYVRPYVRRHKTDRTDAEALLEALRSGNIPHVAVKTVAQQEVLALHRLRAQWMTTRTARLNAMRGLLLEQGIAIARGARTILTEVGRLLADEDPRVPPRLRLVLTTTRDEVRDLEDRVDAVERELATLAADDPVIQRRSRDPTADADSRRRPADGHGAGRDGRSHPCVSPGAPLRELARAHPTRMVEWRLAASRRHYETRRRLSAVFAHAWRPRRPADGGARGARRPAAHAPAAVGADRPAGARPQQSDDRRRE